MSQRGYPGCGGQAADAVSARSQWKMHHHHGKFQSEICTVILWQDYCGKGNSRKFCWNTVGEKLQIGNAYLYIEKKGLRLSVYVDDFKLAGKKQNMDPMSKVLMEEVDLGEPTSFFDHVYLGCTQRECETSKDIVDNYRHVFESRISAEAKEKLPCSAKLDADISSWFYDMEGHAKKCVERYCELANKTTQQPYKVTTPCHQFIKEDLQSVGELSKNMLSNCPEMPVFGTHWETRQPMVSKQTCTSSHQRDQSLWQMLGSFDFLYSSHKWI